MAATQDLVTRDFLSYALIGSKELDPRREKGESNKIQYDHNTILDFKFLLQNKHRAQTSNQSMCTLDKVKSALERAGRESQSKKQRSDGSDSSSSLNSSMKRRVFDQEVDDSMDSSDSSKVLVAAGCPSCLMYVLISKENPNCPRCGSLVPAPALVVSKKPKFDLNCS